MTRCHGADAARQTSLCVEEGLGQRRLRRRPQSETSSVDAAMVRVNEPLRHAAAESTKVEDQGSLTV